MKEESGKPKAERERHVNKAVHAIFCAYVFQELSTNYIGRPSLIFPVWIVITEFFVYWPFFLSVFATVLAIANAF